MGILKESHYILTDLDFINGGKSACIFGKKKKKAITYPVSMLIAWQNLQNWCFFFPQLDPRRQNSHWAEEFM